MNIAVLFAGGVGSRMQSKSLPKQFLNIHGVPIIVRTVELFQTHKDIDAIVVSCHPDWLEYCSNLLASYDCTKVKAIVSGGATGQLSIYNGLCAARDIADSNGDDRNVVLIHDGVRPLINAKTISDNILSVREHGSAVTSVPVTETIVTADTDGQIREIHPREQLRIARAPQSFYLDEILGAHEKALADGRKNFIDSATMMRHYGHKLYLVDGPVENIKVTTPSDFFSLQAILNARENEQIYGVATNEE
jgi:2-C-methyl-D-erythritol 4-phosphate cytidylyltransferase